MRRRAIPRMVASFVWGYAIPGDEMEITSRKKPGEGKLSLLFPWGKR